MENTAYIALSRQSVLHHNMAIIANNIANVNTPGYRAQNTIFSEYLTKPEGNKDALSFVVEHGQYQNTNAGPVSQTGNSLDVALIGPGFFGIQGPGGETTYSRAGNFQIDEEGILRTATGFAVADDGGGDITIPDDATEISIDEEGVISDQGGEIAKLMVVEFANYQNLKPIGNGLYATTEAGIEAENTKAKQGYVEGSNVQAVLEMTRMIDTLRSDNSTQRLVQTEHDRLRTAIQRLTQGAQ